jgi:hypothetical protein
MDVLRTGLCTIKRQVAIEYPGAFWGERGLFRVYHTFQIRFKYFRDIPRPLFLPGVRRTWSETSLETIYLPVNGWDEV